MRKMNRRRIRGKLLILCLMGTMFVLSPIGKVNEVKASSIDAEILWVRVAEYNSSVLKAGSDTLYVGVLIKNTGREDHRFWIGFSLKDSKGIVYDVDPRQLSLDGSYIGRGEKGSVTFCWKIPKSFASGSFKMSVAVWEDNVCYRSSRNSNCMRGLIARYKDTTWVNVYGIYIE